MKYHYQFVSINAARIELIAEYESEQLLIAQCLKNGTASPELMAFFDKAVANYRTGAVPRETVFMNFPTVALCRFTEISSPMKTSLNKNQLDQLALEL